MGVCINVNMLSLDTGLVLHYVCVCVCAINFHIITISFLVSIIYLSVAIAD